MNISDSVDDLPVSETTLFFLSEDGLSSQLLFNPSEEALQQVPAGFKQVTEAEWREWENQRVPA